MIDKIEYIRAWESRVGERTLHLNKENFSEKELKDLYFQFDMLIDFYNFENKSILDLGCGGGLLGTYLNSKNIRIKKYIGLDVADRCITEARLNNLCWEHDVVVDLIKIDPFNFDLNIKANFLIILNLIRFLPDIEYVLLFLDKINKSKINNIFLHFRKENQNLFRERPYKTTHDIGQANYLNLDFVIKQMNKYNAEKIKNRNDDCYLFLKKKRKKKNDNTISY